MRIGADKKSIMSLTRTPYGFEKKKTFTDHTSASKDGDLRGVSAAV